MPFVFPEAASVREKCADRHERFHPINGHSAIVLYFVLAPYIRGKRAPLKVCLAVTSISVFISRLNGELVVMSVGSHQRRAAHRLTDSFTSEIIK